MKPFFDLELVEWDGETPIVERYCDVLIFDMDDACEQMEERGIKELHCHLCVKVHAPRFDVDFFDDYYCSSEWGGRVRESVNDVFALAADVQAKINEFCAKHPMWEIGSKRVCVKREEPK